MFGSPAPLLARMVPAGIAELDVGVARSLEPALDEGEDGIDVSGPKAGELSLRAVGTQMQKYFNPMIYMHNSITAIFSKIISLT